MSVSIKYKGAEIASANTDTTKTIKTSGKYCEADIEVVNTQDGGITPSGNINITNTNVTDVTQYATATVVDADLVAENIKKDVNILGVVGSFEGGGGSLPSSISKIDGGSFTLASDTVDRNYSISHNLGIAPKGFAIWSDLSYGSTEPTIKIASVAFGTGNYSETNDCFYCVARKLTSGLINPAAGVVNSGQWINGSTFKCNVSLSYKAGITYQWLAWA